MKIENETLYINKIDLDHILGYSEPHSLEELIAWKQRPPSELFVKGLEIELSLNGLEDETFNKIIIEKIWE